MQLNTNTFTQFVNNIAIGIQGACASLLDFNAGSVLLSIVQAFAGQALWIQDMFLRVLITTRLMTSTGSDIDSFVNDFSLTRLPAIAASGSVTFSRYSTTSTALIPVGATVVTADNSQSFTVIQDSSNTYWNSGLNGFLVPIGVASANCTVVAVTAGAGGNVLANTISLLSTSIPGISTVNNAAGFTSGINGETDAQLQARFTNYIQTRAQATPSAVAYAVSQVQPNLTYVIQENVNANSVYTPASFVVCVDDGSGYPPSSLLNSVSTAVNIVRPIGSTFFVTGPTILNAVIAMTLTAAPGYVKANLIPLVLNNIVAYVNALPVGTSLAYSSLAVMAYAVPGVMNVTNITLNGGTADIGGGATQVVMTSVGSVSVS
jgi:uncharacterized phage protein gp47/JayE